MSGLSTQDSIISDLKKKYTSVDYNGKKPKQIYERLPQMLQHAEQMKKKGKETEAFLFLDRWCEGVKWLRKTKEYQVNKLYNIDEEKVKEVSKAMSEIITKIERERSKNMALKNKSEQSINKINIDSIPPKSTANSSFPDVLLALPEIPNDDPLSNEAEEFISCNQLFQLIMQGEDRSLIIDVRPQADFEFSHIRAVKYINIPDKEIKSGIVPHQIEKYLSDSMNKDFFNLFRERGNRFVDTTILIDWNTSKKNLKNNSTVSMLKNMLLKWDYGVSHNKLVILDGGYTEWLSRYPTYTTNANVKAPDSNDFEVDMSEILSDIQYPDFVHESERERIAETKEMSLRKLKNELKSNDFSTKLETRNFSPVQTFNKTITNIPTNVKIRLTYEEDDSKTNETEIQPNKTVNRPIIDRSTKPTSNATTQLKLLRKKYNVAREQEKLYKEILKNENLLYKERLMKNHGSSEEENIQKNVSVLQKKLEDVERAFDLAENDLHQFGSSIKIDYSNSENAEKNELLLDLSKIKQRIKHILSEREKLYKNTLALEHAKSTRQKSLNDENTYKEPLKDSPVNTPSLERSHSSPNLLQLRDRKIPQIDRSSKPQILDHDDYRPTNTVIKSSHLSREEHFNPIHGNVPPGITGLKNLGNSCYMNSIIQCLSNTVQLAKYFNDSYVDDLKRNKGNSMQAQVAEEVALVIKALWRGQYKSISPHDLKVVVGQYKLQFGSYEQQDSHEFLTFLLDWMHNDLKREKKLPPNMSAAEKDWNKAMDSQTSKISELFFGQLRSTITCAFCKEASTTYETFNSLTMSLPDSNRCTLNNCIQKFLSSQPVSGWKCPKCQVPREATKKFDFIKLAPIIVIHLNRFAESGGWLQKRNTAVDFPLTGLNLRPYLAFDDESNINLNNCDYNLYAMSNHYGTMEGGHYTAFCKNVMQNKWYKYDDQTVTEVASNQVKSQTSSAYLLFYMSSSSEL